MKVSSSTQIVMQQLIDFFPLFLFSTNSIGIGPIESRAHEGVLYSYNRKNGSVSRIIKILWFFNSYHLMVREESILNDQMSNASRFCNVANRYLFQRLHSLV